MRSDRLKQLAVGADVSGSMQPAHLLAQMSEVKYVWDYLKPRSLRLMSFDTVVHDNILYQEGDQIQDVELHGGGGTNVGPFIDYLRKDQPELALIMTDGHFSMPDLSNLNTDIFWIINDHPTFRCSHGTVIHFDS